MASLLEWGGSICGVAGAALLAANIKYSHWGWWLFALSSVYLSIFAWEIEAYGLLLLHGCFTVTNVIGLHRVWLPTFLEKRH